MGRNCLLFLSIKIYNDDKPVSCEGIVEKPLEDVGGEGGYEEYLRIMADVIFNSLSRYSVYPYSITSMFIETNITYK